MDRRICKTHAAVKKAYLELLKEAPNSRLTISAIARRANIDRKTFYLHYESPDAILDEIYDDIIAEAMNELHGGDDGEGRYVSVCGLFELITAMIAKHLDIFEILAVRKYDSSLFEKLRLSLISRLESECKDKLGLTETQFRIYSEFFMSGIIAAYKVWISSHLPLRTEELAEMVTNASLSGLYGVLSLKEKTQN